MEVTIKVSSLFVLLIMVLSCTTPRPLPEKYNLDNYLEEVSEISVSRDMDCGNRDINCENVDTQSIMLTVNWVDYYLLVLRKPIVTQYSLVSVNISNSASRDRAYSAETILSGQRDAIGRGEHSRTDFHQAPSNIAHIVPGFDRVFVTPSADPQGYAIKKIYKLKGKEQTEEIKAWLRKDEDAEIQIIRTHRFDVDSQ